ncbi:LuxR C-terminal-related transcriptional regulator [Streptomyces sp. NBC_00659]|uniref:LuxR C-terminal-related transcriptional regulator n=1 Tax=unclassified Streptomyces TaxID=2593676 RepID=UPI002E2D2F8F|nr:MULTISPECIES: LuxR C-terminal-related transcriptional regulator [unclassified Streptomyces]
MSITDTLGSPVRKTHVPPDRPVLTRDHAWDTVMRRVPLLSERELDVFHLLAKGASNRTISTRLAITERTAKAHVAQILAKLDVESRLQAGIVAFAWETFSRGGGTSACLSPYLLLPA